MPHVVVRCAGQHGGTRCTNRLEFPAIGKTPPEHVAKHIRGKAWDFTLGNGARTRCPDCQQRERAGRAGDSGKRMVTVLGQSVEVRKELAALAPAQAVTAKPLKDHHLTIRSDRTLIDLLRALQGYGEVLHTSSEPVEPAKGTKARGPARYIDPLNPQNEWTGRGRRPVWLREFLEVPGHSLDQCEVEVRPAAANGNGKAH